MKQLLLIYPFILLILSACNGSGTPSLSNSITRDDGATQLSIDLSGSLQNPAFIHDGKSIVFTRFRDGYNKGASDLYIYDLESKTLEVLISDDNGNVNLPGSIWDSSTNSIIFSSEQGEHDEIFIISDIGKTGEEIQITDRENKQSYEPSFSSNGQWTVFESHDIDVEDDGVITKFKVDGSSEYINLTAAEDNCKQPNWSPLGDKILYQKQESGNWGIWTMDTDGNNHSMITDSDESSTDAVFSYDGQSIIYSSENDNVNLANIYKAPLNGDKPSQITTYSGYDGAPSISPDNLKVVFESTEDDPDESSGTKIWIINLTQ